MQEQRKSQRRTPRRSGSPQVRVDFAPTAEAIVRHVQQRVLGGTLSARERRVFQNLGAPEIRKIADSIIRSFETRQMGLQQLTAMAGRELGILAIRETTPRYSVDLLAVGVEPAQYFDQFYKNKFLRFGLTAAAISVVDSNLHTQLKGRGQFPKITASLAQGPTA